MTEMVGLTTFCIAVVHPDYIPQRAHEYDAGLDLKARVDAPVLIPPLHRALIPTGVYMDQPCWACSKIEGRSGLAWKQGIAILGGVIDSPYRGEISAILHNTDPHATFVVKPLDRIAQLLSIKVFNHEFRVIPLEELSTSVRGEQGFGSTG